MTYFTNAVRFFGLERLWECDVQEKFFEEERAPSLRSPASQLLGRAASRAAASAKTGAGKKSGLLGRLFGR